MVAERLSGKNAMFNEKLNLPIDGMRTGSYISQQSFNCNIQKIQ